MARMNGGITAPGLGRRRPPTDRQNEIARVGRSARVRNQGQMQRLPGGGLQQGTAVGNAVMPGPGGAQLARRVASGAINQEQAQRTMQQRQTLRKAFGPDFRQKVFGDVGYLQRTRAALAKDPNNPQVAALNKQLMQRRQKMLAAAKARLSGA